MTFHFIVEKLQDGATKKKTWLKRGKKWLEMSLQKGSGPIMVKRKQKKQSSQTYRLTLLRLLVYPVG